LWLQGQLRGGAINIKLFAMIANLVLTAQRPQGQGRSYFGIEQGPTSLFQNIRQGIVSANGLEVHGRGV
jgi:hypothetical protein